MGEMLREMEMNKGTRGQLHGKNSSGGYVELPPEDTPTLSEQGVSRMQSSGFQKQEPSE